MDATLRVLGWYGAEPQFRLPDRGSAWSAASPIETTGRPDPDETIAKAKPPMPCCSARWAVRKWDGLPFERSRERGLLRLRKDLELFANLRPALCFDALKDASTLKPEIVSGLDILIVRELTGGVYFGEPKETTTLPDGQKRAVDTQVYTTSEIERIARVAFELARLRGKSVASARKIQCDGHRRAVARSRHRRAQARISRRASSPMSWPTIAPCSWCAIPSSSTCIVTDNLFGDVLSDEAAQLTGSIGMLPSASLGAKKANGKQSALYEPIHGSAPDIAGKGLANPIASILSFAMCLRYSFGREGRRGAAGKGGGTRAGRRLSHRRHHAARHDQGRHDGDDGAMRCASKGSR